MAKNALLYVSQLRSESSQGGVRYAVLVRASVLYACNTQYKEAVTNEVRKS